MPRAISPVMPATLNTAENMNLLPIPQVSTVTLRHPAVGLSPAGFPRIHVEILPREVGRIVGYDPRAIVVKQVRGRALAPRTMPHNVSQGVVDLQNRVQRSIDNSRVAIMVDYLHNALANGEFADWGPIELVTAHQVDLTDLDTDGVIRVDSDADYFIADGQHRYCAILDFVRAYPDYADKFTQAVTISVIPQDKLGEWAGQAFHDRNYFAQAVRAGKALSVDARDPVNALAKELGGHDTIMAAGGIAYERDTLLAGDPRFTTHSVLHRFVKGFLVGRSGLERSTHMEPGDMGTEETRANLWDYISLLGEVLPWAPTDTSKEGIAQRDGYLSRASAVIAALAVVGHDLFGLVQSGALKGEEIAPRVQSLGRLDWRRSNLAWAGVLGVEKDGKVQPGSSRPAIDATIRFFRERLGILTLLQKVVEAPQG
jgi:DGQHR domain-containing protein